MKYGFGVDLGGTTVKIAFFDEIGNMLDKWEIPTIKDDGGAQILPDIAKAIQVYRVTHQLSVHELLGLGIGVPGPVDQDGVVHTCANLGWDVVDRITMTK